LSPTRGSGLGGVVDIEPTIAGSGLDDEAE
jgi:hypothetical protein